MRDLEKEPLEGLIPSQYTKKYKQYKKLEKELQKMDETFREYLADQMKECNIDNIRLDGLIFSYVKESTTSKIDSERLKKEAPDIYEKFVQYTNKSAHIRVCQEK